MTVFFDKIEKGVFAFSSKDVIKQAGFKNFTVAGEGVNTAADDGDIRSVFYPGGKFFGVIPLVCYDGKANEVRGLFFDSVDKLFFVRKRFKVFAELPESDFVAGLSENRRDVRQAVIETNLRAGIGINKKYFHNL